MSSSWMEFNQSVLAMGNMVLIEQWGGSKDKGISQSTTTEKERFKSEWMADLK